MSGKQVNLSTAINTHSALLHDAYEIEKVLGKGGSGIVFKAWHTRLCKHVVIKEVSSANTFNLESHRNEVEALKQIKSPYMPLVYDFFLECSASHTVLEYIDGESFDKIINREEVFCSKLYKKWYFQLACALATLHSQNISHRDIKPDNIILTKSGDICLIDFNSAFVSGNNTKHVSRSISYSSPEQHAYYSKCKAVYGMMSGYREKTKDNASYVADLDPGFIDWHLSDIYSLGATMYHIISGSRPYWSSQGMPGVDSLSAVISPRVNLDKDPLLDKLLCIVYQSLQHNPKDRFSSSTELAFVIENMN